MPEGKENKKFKEDQGKIIMKQDSGKGREFTTTTVTQPAKAFIAGESSQKEAHAEPFGTVFISPSMHFTTTTG